MWKALLCLLLATATLSTAGRKRQNNRAPTFYNLRPEFVSDDEFVPVEAGFPAFGLKAALDHAGAGDASEDSSAQEDNEGKTKSGAGPPTEVDDSKSDSSDSDENETPPPAAEHRSLPKIYIDKEHKKPGKGWDASYAFGYDLEDQARHETSDPHGNVNGFYSFVDDEGTLRKITYTAGAGKGFVVLNKDKVKGFSGKRPRKPFIGVVNTDSSNNQDKVYEGPPAEVNTSGGGGDDDESSGAPGEGYPGRPWGALAIKNTGKGGKKKKPIFVVKIRRPVNKNFPPARNPGRPKQPPYGGEDDGEWQEPAASSGIGDSSYSFAYDAGSSNRKEVADPWGNVRGSYSYIDPAGIRRTVNYIAGGTTGFKVLSASPTLVQNVYEQPPTSYVPRRNVNRRLVPLLRGAVPIPQPSAIVYHIHPDGGWKPWEPKKSRRSSRKRANPIGKDSTGSASELNNNVQIDSGSEGKVKSSEPGETVLVQTHPPQQQKYQQEQQKYQQEQQKYQQGQQKYQQEQQKYQQEQQKYEQEERETTTFASLSPSPIIATVRTPVVRVHTHGQRSWTGDDEEASYIAFTPIPPQSSEFHNDATLFDPSNFNLGEGFALAEDTRHPVPAQLSALNGLNVQVRAYQGFGEKIPSQQRLLTSESKISQDHHHEEEMTGEATTMNPEIVPSTTSMTQMEKPRNNAKEDASSGDEVTTVLPPPSSTSSSRRHNSSKKKQGNSNSSKSHAQTVQRMTREQTTKSTAALDPETEADTHVETISLSSRLVKRLAVPPTTTQSAS